MNKMNQFHQPILEALQELLKYSNESSLAKTLVIYWKQLLFKPDKTLDLKKFNEKNKVLIWKDVNRVYIAQEVFD